MCSYVTRKTKSGCLSRFDEVVDKRRCNETERHCISRTLLTFLLAIFAEHDPPGSAAGLLRNILQRKMSWLASLTRRFYRPPTQNFCKRHAASA